MEISRNKPEPNRSTQIPLLRDVLVYTTFIPGRVLSRLVTQFELRVFNQEALDLINLSRNHPNDHEFGKNILVTHARKVRIPVNPDEGDENAVRWQPYRTEIFSLDPTLPKEMRQELFIGFGMHSHPDETDPSFEDISELLVGDFEPSASTGVFVVNYRKKVIMLRGERTPQVSRQEALQEVAKWKKDVETQAIRAVLNRQLITDVRTFLGGLANQKTNEVIEQYDLRYFDCPLEESVARLRV